MKTKNAGRTNLMIDPINQRRILKYGLSLALIMWCSLFFGTWKFVHSLDQTTTLIPVTEQTKELLQALNQLKTNIVYFFGVSAMLLMAGISLAFLTLSHRIAGPIYKLKKHMEMIAKGNPQAPIKLRKDDFFMDFADTYNEFIVYKENQNKKIS